jgi:two-component system sensor histidine kinase KdpD
MTGPRGSLVVYLGIVDDEATRRSMLAATAERAAHGDDVVVACADATREELDLEGLLARRPVAAVLGRLAHRSAPGAKHELRWQDAQDLLGAGIDVYGLVRVDEIDSLCRLAGQWTGHQAEDVVPEEFLRTADALLVVDGLSDALGARAAAGLRRLALRWAARGLDPAVSDGRGHAGAELRDERVVVEIRGDESGSDLLHRAAAYAAARKLPWLAVAVHTPDTWILPEYDRARLEDQTLLARRLGAETVVAAGERRDETLLSVARAYGGTQLVLPLPRPGPRFRHGHRELRSLLERSNDIEFHLVDVTSAL